jgi:hypothetical protein
MWRPTERLEQMDWPQAQKTQSCWLAAVLECWR